MIIPCRSATGSVLIVILLAIAVAGHGQTDAANLQEPDTPNERQSLYILTSRVWPSGISEVACPVGGGVARAISNIDFTRIPQNLLIQTDGGTYFSFLNFSQLVEAADPDAWPQRMPSAKGSKEFVTGWDGPEVTKQAEDFFAALECLHAFVEDHSPALAKLAEEERERAEQVNLQDEERKRLLEGKFEQFGRIPETAGVKHVGTLGGKRVEPHSFVVTGMVTSELHLNRAAGNDE